MGIPDIPLKNEETLDSSTVLVFKEGESKPKCIPGGERVTDESGSKFSQHVETDITSFILVFILYYSLKARRQTEWGCVQQDGCQVLSICVKRLVNAKLDDTYNFQE